MCVSEWARSQLLPVVSRVPQGSIIGPLLFLAYINDLPQCSSFSRLLLFADDAKCLHKIKCLLDGQSDLDSLGCWSGEWKLLFKDTKCKHLRLSSGIPPSDFRYTINDNLVALEDTHRDLGVIIFSSLTFTAHYNFIASRARLWVF